MESKIKIHDKYYKFLLEEYDFLSEEDKKWFDRRRNYTFEKWAKAVAKDIVSEEHTWDDYCEIMDIDFKIYFKTLGEYSLAIKYWGGYRNKVYVKHNSKKCGHYKFWVSPISLVSNKVCCPICKESLGEVKVRTFLVNNKIKFIPEYSFDDLRGKNNRKLRFDFGIFDKNNNLTSLIEFDGTYHYKVYKRSTAENLAGQQYRDELKNQYCKDNNIKLLRIPYWEYQNIYEILQKELL